MIDPVCFHVGPRPIYWYGILVAAAFLVCLAALVRLGRREGRSPTLLSDLVFWIMIGAMLGARAAYVAANWAYFAARPGAIIRLDQGGMIYYGGLAGAALAGVVFARLKHEPWRPLWDLVAVVLPLGHALGRLGCFLNGCCYGRVCDLPWAVPAAGALRHPTQLYEAGFNLALSALLWRLYPRWPRNGRIGALYLLLYPLGRLALELFRGDERLRWLGCNVAQEISVGLMLAGAALWLTAPRTPARPAADRPPTAG